MPLTDLNNIGQGTQIVADHQNAINSRAVRTEWLDSGVSTASDLVTNAAPISATFPGAAALEAKNTTVIKKDGGKGLKYTTYQRPRFKTGSGGTFANALVDYRPASISLPWYTLSLTSGTGQDSWDATDYYQHNEAPIPFHSRQIQVLHILVRFDLSSNPIGTISHMIDKTNNATFTIDGVGYLANTLMFMTPTLQNTVTNLAGTAKRYIGFYHFIARTSGHFQQRVKVSNKAVERTLMYEQVAYTIPPM